MRGGEGRVVIGKGVGQRGGQAAIMMCSCDGGWNGGDGSLKSVFERNLGCEPWILTKFLVGNLDRRCPRCMEEGSRNGGLLWAGRHGSC